MTKRLIYWLFRLALAFVSIIPLSILYRISDGLAWLLQYVIRYRKKVVYQNLSNSFPKKTDNELNIIVKQFYKHFADIVLEGLKGYSMSPEQLIPRYKIHYDKNLKHYYDNNQSVIFVGSHYNNWEWGVMCGGLQLPHHVMCYYQPIRNHFIDDFYRKQFSTDRHLTTVSKQKAVKNFIKNRHETFGHLLIADQSPVSRNNAVWLEFLNQDTICIIGPEKLARKFNYPLFYFEAKRVKRGYYELNIVEFESNPKTTEDGEITTRFMKMLENRIKETPANWLWSHKRWKKKRQQN